MTRALILGGGIIGSAMAMDLAREPFVEVSVADVRPEALDRVAAKYGAGKVVADLSDPDVVKRVVEPFDIVLGAISSGLGYRTLRAVLEAGKNTCDVSFMAENALDLTDLAKERGAVAVVDCGIAPGMSNMMVGFARAELDTCQSIEIYVGGLPVVRSWPFEYKVGFAPHDAIEEYVRPARLVEHGKLVVREALSEPELLEFPGVGTLEAFNTDGLRSLAYTLDAPFMREKTLRYPGHIEQMRVLRSIGLFSKDPVDLGGTPVVPLDLLAKLLFPKWTFEEGEEDLTVMRVIVDGMRDGEPRRYTWDLLDRYHQATSMRSMSRTTAFPATRVAMLLANKTVREPGVYAPEHLGKTPGLLASVLDGLAKRGIVFDAKVEEHQKTSAMG